jgi:hypothetical protein
MKKWLSYVLLLVLLFSYFPIYQGESNPNYQYKFISGSGDDISSHYTNTSQSAIGLVVYSTTQSSISSISEWGDSFNLLVLSNIEFNGHIGVENVFLLGEAKYISGNITKIGINEEGNPLAAIESNFSDEDLSNNLAESRIRTKYTGDQALDHDESYYDLFIDQGVTITVNSRLRIDKRLTVNGSLVGSAGGVLELRQGSSFDLSNDNLYESDANTIFDVSRLSNQEYSEFEYINDKWVYRSQNNDENNNGPGDNPIEANEFTISMNPVEDIAEVSYSTTGSAIDITDFSLPVEFNSNEINFNISVYDGREVVEVVFRSNNVERRYSLENGLVIEEVNDTKTYSVVINPIETDNNGYFVFDLEIVTQDYSEPQISDNGFSIDFNPPEGSTPPTVRYKVDLDSQQEQVYNQESGPHYIEHDEAINFFIEAGSFGEYDVELDTIEVEHGNGDRYVLSVDNGITYENNLYTFAITPVQVPQIRSSKIYFGFRVKLNWKGNPGSDDNNQGNSYYWIMLNYDDAAGEVSLDQYEVFEYGEYGVEEGTDLVLTVKPGEFNKIREIYIDGDQKNISNPYVEQIFEIKNIDRGFGVNVEFIEYGDGSSHVITIKEPNHGTIEASVGEVINNEIDVLDGYYENFRIIPDEGYALQSFTIESESDIFDYTRYLTYHSEDRVFTFYYDDITEDFNVEAVFVEEDITGVLDRSYAVLIEPQFTPFWISSDFSTLDSGDDYIAEIKEALTNEFANIGYTIAIEEIEVSNVSNVDAEVGYGTFDFTIRESSIQQGYIVESYDHVLFKVSGLYNNDKVEEVRVANLLFETGGFGSFGVPPIDLGYLEVFGPNYVHIEGYMSPDVRGAFEGINENKLEIKQQYYRVQLHITNKGSNYDDSLNWFAFDLIQDNAFALKVDAQSGGFTQETYEWSLNRYAELSTGSYASEVFFGNDTFVISLPDHGLGDIKSLEIEEGNFRGYNVTKVDQTYEVVFLSDFYNKVVLNLLINEELERTLTVNRVGVKIDSYERHEHRYGGVLHGTQPGSRIDFDQGEYQVYATYYIPDFNDEAPYGIYVTKHYSSGLITTEVIDELVMTGNDMTEDKFSGVFIPEDNENESRGFVSSCDYLLYTGNKANAPISIYVTVLKDNLSASDEFGGVFFGSGAGVQWDKS